MPLYRSIWQPYDSIRTFGIGTDAANYSLVLVVLLTSSVRILHYLWSPLIGLILHFLLSLIFVSVWYSSFLSTHLVHIWPSLEIEPSLNGSRPAQKLSQAIISKKLVLAKPKLSWVKLWQHYLNCTKITILCKKTNFISHNIYMYLHLFMVSRDKGGGKGRGKGGGKERVVLAEGRCGQGIDGVG